MAPRPLLGQSRLNEEAFRFRLRANEDAAVPTRVRLPVSKGRGGLVVGVNTLSNKALLAALDEDA